MMFLWVDVVCGPYDLLFSCCGLCGGAEVADSDEDFLQDAVGVLFLTDFSFGGGKRGRQPWQICFVIRCGCPNFFVNVAVDA